MRRNKRRAEEEKMKGRRGRDKRKGQEERGEGEEGEEEGRTHTGVISKTKVE